jgi:type III restriction enzyme
LPVGSDGERIYDESINRLTVIASESFEEYAKGLQSEMEADIGGGFKFGRIPKIAFARLLDEKTDQPIGQERSEWIWNALKVEGYLDDEGNITPKFTPETAGFELQLPEEMVPLRFGITDEMKRFIFKNRVVNSRERRTLKFNKRIELNEEFKILWEQINKKTRYSVEFETEDLIQRAVDKIHKMEKIRPVRIFVDKADLDITEAGVEQGRVSDSRTIHVKPHSSLPDILAYLQRETELTRWTLVEILKRSGRLQEFGLNPQTFMTDTAKLINRALRELVVDGIKYEQIDGECYEMRLFEEHEIETYLSKLYEVQYNYDATPYDYVPYDSDVELHIAEGLDADEKVKFFCGLWCQPL